MQTTLAAEGLIRVVQSVTANINLREDPLVTEDDVTPIKQFVAALTPASVGLAPHAHAYITPATPPGNIRYLHIAQEDAYSIGVFVLPPGACIPLHDHPNMCVVSHILYGAVRITCYDPVQVEAGGSSSGSSSSSGIMASTSGFGVGEGGSGGGGGGGSGADSEGDDTGSFAVLRDDGWHVAPHTSCLTPHRANLHQLEAGQQGVAVLDVLIPPYDVLCGRDCTYYRADPVIPAAMGGGRGGAVAWSGGGAGASTAGHNTNVVKLVRCSPGDSYAVVPGDFMAPYATGFGFGHGS